MAHSGRALVVVTGGAGFIGSHTVDALLERGARVRVLDNLSSGSCANLPRASDRLEFIEADINDARAVDAAMAGATHCLHLAAQVSVIRSVEDPVHSAHQNILGFVSLLDAARRRSVGRFVYASSAAVYGDPETLPLDENTRLAPLSPYGLEKQVDEQYAALYRALHGQSAMGMRYFNVYGPRQDPASPYAGVISKFVEVLSRGEAPTVYGDGGQTRDFVFVKDVARANVAALFSAHDGVCNVATGARIDLLQLIDALSDVTGANVRPVHVKARADDIRHSCGDASRLREWLGVAAEWPLAAGLNELVRANRSAATVGAPG